MFNIVKYNTKIGPHYLLLFKRLSISALLASFILTLRVHCYFYILMNLYAHVQKKWKCMLNKRYRKITTFTLKQISACRDLQQRYGFHKKKLKDKHCKVKFHPYKKFHFLNLSLVRNRHFFGCQGQTILTLT